MRARRAQAGAEISASSGGFNASTDIFDCLVSVPLNSNIHFYEYLSCRMVMGHKPLHLAVSICPQGWPYVFGLLPPGWHQCHSLTAHLILLHSGALFGTVARVRSVFGVRRLSSSPRRRRLRIGTHTCCHRHRFHLLTTRTKANGTPILGVDDTASCTECRRLNNALQRSKRMIWFPPSILRCFNNSVPLFPPPPFVH